MDFTQLLNSDLGNQIISGISKNAGTNEKDTKAVVSESFPVLLGMLKNNASTEDGNEGILQALKKHDGSILNNISGFLNGDDSSDGDKILGHVLGKNQNTVENALSAKTGVDLNTVKKILPLLAPIILGYLGKQSKGQGQFDLGGILGDLLGGKSNAAGDILSSVLGKNAGGILDAFTGGGGKKKTDLGGLLGGLFGKK